MWRRAGPSCPLPASGSFRQHPWCGSAAVASPSPAALDGFTYCASLCLSLPIPAYRVVLLGLFGHTLFLRGIVTWSVPMETFVPISYMLHKHMRRKRPCPEELWIMKPEKGHGSPAMLQWYDRTDCGQRWAPPEQDHICLYTAVSCKHSQVVRGRQHCVVSRWETEAKRLSNLSICLTELRNEPGPSSSTPTASPPS